MPTFDLMKPEYAILWASAEVRPTWRARVAEAVSAIIAHQARYVIVADESKVPWWWIGAIHQMECGGSFAQHLHNGDPLTARTVQVPKGRPVTGTPPFTWEVSAFDSLSMKPGSDVLDWGAERALYEAESYNGWGYRNNHPETLSPYLWSGTTHYISGKYVADHVWSASAVSGQVGVAAIMLGLIAAGVDLGFGAASIPANAPALPTDTDLKPYEIQAIQRGLASLNYGVGAIDGIRGRLWVQSVSGFQHDHNIAVTGKWSTECANALAEALAKGKTASVAEARVNATAADVKAAGIQPVAHAQTLVYTGTAAVVGSIAKVVTDGNGNISIDKANDLVTHARAAKGWLDSATSLLSDFGAWIYAHPILAVGVIGGAVTFWGAKIGKDAIESYRKGKL